MGRKGFSVPLVILLVIILLSTGIILFLVQFKPANLDFQDANRKVSNEAPTPSPELAKQSSAKSTSECDVSYMNGSQIEGSKTYQNHTYGFEIQIPLKYFHTDLDCAQGGTRLSTNDNKDGAISFYVDDVVQRKEKYKNDSLEDLRKRSPDYLKSAVDDFIVATSANEILLNFRRLNSLYSCIEAGCPESETVSYLSINNHPSIKYSYTVTGGYTTIRTVSIITYSILVENDIYSFSITGLSDPPKGLLDDIAKSFKILPE